MSSNESKLDNFQLESFFQNRLEDWKSRLIDLSKKNRLLYFKPTKSNYLSISNPNMASFFNKLFLRKKKLEFWIPPDISESINDELHSKVNLLPFSTDIKPKKNKIFCNITNRKDLERILKNLNRRSRSDYREKGLRILYATFGKLIWKDPLTNEENKSPLLLIPIELNRDSVHDPFTISIPPIEEEVLFNPALQVKLENDFKLELPPLPDFLLKSSLEDYLNSIEEVVCNLGWKIEHSVEIGLFSYHKLVIYKDLELNKNLISKHPLIRAITDNKKTKLLLNSLPKESEIDKIEDPKEIFQVLDADSSQRVAIRFALDGQSFVMQGPPGTGKSQTITNIISECIAQGKSVLFVSDKMAALDIVYKRLKAAGLSHFCLELHSSKANKRAVVAELKKSLDEQLIPKKIPTQEDFKRLSQQRNQLTEYVTILHKKHLRLEKTPYEVLGRLADLEKIPFIPVKLSNIESLNPFRINELQQLMVNLKRTWKVIEEPDFPWYGYLGKNYNMEICSDLSKFLDEILLAFNTLQWENKKFSESIGLSPVSNFNQINWLIELGSLLKSSPRPEIDWVLNPNLDLIINEAKDYQQLNLWIKKARDILLQLYDKSVFKIDPLRSLEIEKILSDLSKSLNYSNLEESKLLIKYEELLSFAKKTLLHIESWISYSKELSAIFGLKDTFFSINRVKQLSQLASYCFSEIKPELHWLNPKNLPNKNKKFKEIKEDYIEYQKITDKINLLYTDKIYDIDLKEYIRLYSGPYNNPFRWLRPSYYKSQKALSLLSLDGKVPSTILEDLRSIRRRKLLQSKIQSLAKLTKNLTGHYYNGLETNFQNIENAIEIATEVFTLSETTHVPYPLATFVSVSSNPPQKIKQIGQNLNKSIKDWSQSLNNILPFISENHFLKTNLSIYEIDLSKLKNWISKLETQLQTLCLITAEPLKLRKNKPTTYKEFLDELKKSELIRQKKQEIKNNKEILKDKFGFRFIGLNSNWNEIISVLEWTKKIHKLFNNVHIPKKYAYFLYKGPNNVPQNIDLSNSFENSKELLLKFESRFEKAITIKNRPLIKLNLLEIINQFKEYRNRIDELQLWIDFKKTRNNFSETGLAPFFELLVDRKPSSSQIIDILKRGIYQQWIEWFFSENPTLGDFRRETHEQLINEFKKLDRKLIRLSSNRVISEANNRKPQDIIIKAVDSEVNTLLKESAKKRRIMPIRNLIQKIPNLLFKLKPCLLMSPISVSQFLEPELMKFDLVLFDEASQIVPEDAIGAIYRGKTIVVAGDNKQLPPTSFFRKSLIDDYDWDETNDGEIEVFDSILDEFSGIGLPVKTLRWHYRSKHEELISFSNSKFYDDSLITFPSAKAKAEHLGVKLNYVKNGIYDRGGSRKNFIEAEKVADLVFGHFCQNPQKTLGVVTFSIAQMEAIEEAIEHRLKEKPAFEDFFKEDRLEGFFVKNLENVQGDERDIIIFSIGYGRDYENRITMNFGPLNKPGGERRLNVAVTRAREKILLVSSIRANDINLSDSSPEGVKTLYQYLDYAERGPNALGITYKQPNSFDSRIGKVVASEVKNMGYQVKPQIGFSEYRIDIGIIDPSEPENFILGVECDGSTYLSSSTARDRDRLREQILNQLGWKIHRIWSPTWVSRKDSELKRLKETIEKILKSKVMSNKNIPIELQSTPNCFIDEVEVKKIQFNGIETIGVPYEVHALKASFQPTVTIRTKKYPYSSVQKNEFYFDCNRDLQSNLLEELVNNEGPIHFDYAVKRLASLWKVKRITPKIISAVKEALELLLDDEKIINQDGFLWPKEPKTILVRTPNPKLSITRRKIEHIPHEEIEKAIDSIVYYAIGISLESLIIETAKIFGFKYPREKIKLKISKIFEKMLLSGEIQLKNNIVTLSV